MAALAVVRVAVPVATAAALEGVAVRVGEDRVEALAASLV